MSSILFSRSNHTSKCSPFFALSNGVIFVKWCFFVYKLLSFFYFPVLLSIYTSAVLNSSHDGSAFQNQLIIFRCLCVKHQPSWCVCKGTELVTGGFLVRILLWSSFYFIAISLRFKRTQLFFNIQIVRVKWNHVLVVAVVRLSHVQSTINQRTRINA